ncbi:gal4-like Zn(II)2Cys6 binuclear cluster DNA-binding domain-containing protein [Thermochaetoides thermophila DSM 1495]|uniref:Gal4-like Zn(II)2Cys6 binuclear cluster DNA-binding domain-containing protein n=1 Tax=Chaetomium thermophilum (strain DSM 1495 / CBS 144.50 / IMI 039719) TaxID=759272 RepID=G0S831_CHATD|nr:gal4-like Zn(II)2Cys6 binuclear cluster DNA-binding domain-containing protein [Thermochaetoides thermophila DSM 1495]EGS21078.1 gal4-like Zn(II)2Cys6 binuclear cluster DNA-binding domain-containing protein [Thermochaetoides thermophila DSM 1495]
MTAPITTPAASTPKEAASTRKRRRRAPAGGAADDCFTCAKRNVKCDRRRPYCSQCLEIGNECSGYKTQLTWGVGVASRGKLRGLSLPIAKAPPVNPPKPAKAPAPASSTTRRSTTTTSTTSTTTTTNPATTTTTNPAPTLPTAPWPAEHDDRAGKDEIDMAHHHRNPSMPPVTSPFHPYDVPPISQPEPAPPPGWTHIPFTASMPPNPSDTTRFAPPRGLQIPVTTPNDIMQREMIQTPIDAMSDMDYMSPIAHSFPRDDISTFVHSPMVYDSFPSHTSPIPQSPVASIMMEQTRAPAPCSSLVYAPPELPSSLQSHMSHVDSLDAQLSRKFPPECDVMSESKPMPPRCSSSWQKLTPGQSVPGTPDLDTTYSSSAQSYGPFLSSSSNTDEESVSQSVPDRNPVPWPGPMSIPSQPSSPVLQVSPDLINKIPFFMDYYEKTMCPSMVFIDGPGNPFRDHILRLSSTSRSLQHAICALAACNLRMKRKLSLGLHGRDGERRLDMSPIDSGSSVQPKDQSLAEEYQHRNLAVRLLNEQLNDPERSTHDSVLATILLLCHYRMAESGVAKFQTQFAGVKKILGLRQMSPFPASRESAWMEALFTYLDAVSASINNREPQLSNSLCSVHPDSNPLPLGTENLVGCDRELFKTIVKLGRLNMLSQHRPVQNVFSPPPSLSRTQSSPAPDSPLGPALKPAPPMLGGHERHHSIFGGAPHPLSTSIRFDSTGFSTASMDDEDLLGTSLQSQTAYDDPRSLFWREWKEARMALQSWEFDSARVRASLQAALSPSSSSNPYQMLPNTSSQLPVVPTSAQVRDLNSLSEAFRYAALLYTERLASPHVPSNHNTFRNLVSQVVYYATSLEAGSAAEKFLLWPLFVAGSECVNELQQNIVRSKCRDIMARSGYMNNLAALDILERLWAGECRDTLSRNGVVGAMGIPGVVNNRSGPFNWSKWISGPGVDVEWIMF